MIQVFICKSKGHSKTTLTKFYPIWTHLLRFYIPSTLCQATRRGLSTDPHLPLLVHVVIKWPLKYMYFLTLLSSKNILRYLNENDIKYHNLSIDNGVPHSRMLLFLHHRDSKIFFHPAKFDNFRDEKISDFKTVSVSQSKNLLDRKLVV